MLKKLTDKSFSPKWVTALPVDWARTNRVLPVEIDGEPFLLTADLARFEIHQHAALIAGRPLRAILADDAFIANAIERAYSAAIASKDDSATQSSAEKSPRQENNAPPDLLSSASSVTSAPVTRLVDRILLEAVRENASDIHFEPFADRLVLRYRIDGILQERPAPPKSLESALVSRLKVISGMDIAEKRLPQDGMAQAKVGEKSLDIRVSTIPVADGERVVLRLLNRDDTLRPLSELGMPPELLADFESALRAPNGMIIVSGPTGSGKTTTLYSALRVIDSTRRNVLTIEDPVEYRLPGIGQIQVKPKIGLTFASGLRHILRQDPDVVLVGETRDAETAEIAVRASLTGHLVFTTLHTNDAPSAVMRLIDMGIAPYLLASSLRAILAQRLVRARTPDGTLKGRTGIFELMLCNEAVREAIRRGTAAETDLRAIAIANGMRPLAADAEAKLRAGLTSAEEIATALAT